MRGRRVVAGMSMACAGGSLTVATADLRLRGSW